MSPAAHVKTLVRPLDRELLQPRRGYRFAPESLLLHDLVRQRPGSSRILDLGAGCGVLGLVLAARCDIVTRQTFVELDPMLAEITRLNTEGLAGVEVVEGDLRHVELSGSYDLVVANPPFFDPGEGRPSRNPMTRNATHAYHGALEAFAKVGAARLATGADLWLLHPADRLARALAALAAAELHVHAIAIVHARHTGAPFRCWIRAQRQPGSTEISSMSAWTRR